MYKNRFLNRNRKINERFSQKNYEYLIRQEIIDDEKMKKKYELSYSHLYNEKPIAMKLVAYGQSDYNLVGDILFENNEIKN